MKKIVSAIRGALGLKGKDSGPKVQMIDPGKVRFSIPTLSDDQPALEPVGEIGDDDFAVAEDNWSQVELFGGERLPEVMEMLREYSAFEKANRTAYGWNNVYVRKIERKPLFAANGSASRLTTILGAKIGAAPLVVSSGVPVGRVAGGFTISLGGNVELYGVGPEESPTVLGASVGSNPDDMRLTTAFMALHKAKGLILVDWRQQLALVSVNDNGTVVGWTP